MNVEVIVLTLCNFELDKQNAHVLGTFIWLLQITHPCYRCTCTMVTLHAAGVGTSREWQGVLDILDPQQCLDESLEPDAKASVWG
jgi:hypothetical protein